MSCRGFKGYDVILHKLSLNPMQGLSIQQQQAGDEDAFAYNNTLRRSIFDAYSGIFNGMSRDKINMYMPQYVPVRHFCPSGQVWDGL